MKKYLIYKMMKLFCKRMNLYCKSEIILQKGDFGVQNLYLMAFINNILLQLVMHALKLINLSIARFMSPNLALLVDRTSDSSMANLGPMLIGKLEDADWEVRDSALEVLYTISNIANTSI